MVRKTTKGKLLIALVTTGLLGIYGCIWSGPGSNIPTVKITEEYIGLSPEQLLEKLNATTPVECAVYYKELRETYSFADQLFADSILPDFIYCTYDEMKDVKYILKDTPLDSKVDNIFAEVRNNYLDEIHMHLTEYANAQMELFTDTIIPLVLTDIDTLFASDFEKVLDEYIGFAKIFDSVDDFEEAWNNNIKSGVYANLLNSLLEDYQESISDYYKEYYEDLNIKKGSLMGFPSCNDLNISFPKNAVNKYVDAAIEESITIAVETGIDLVLLFAPGGKITKILEVISNGAIIYDIYNEFNETLSDEEILLLGVTEIVNIKTSELLKNHYAQFFEMQTEYMFNDIKEKL
ncbi:MAG: hypothetical protein IKQ46_00845 [Bacteroidales bacterium]|nr:hypothetical protein [Bacteroidales bacterium]MBR4625889.1 hypothetical protein [Alphaproteobacteria bacterium]